MGMMIKNKNKEYAVMCLNCNVMVYQNISLCCAQDKVIGNCHKGGECIIFEMPRNFPRKPHFKNKIYPLCSEMNREEV
jgi:hypothetical protein